MEEKYTQLVMRRGNFDNLPDIVIPDGFVLRTYRDGDETAWDAIIGEMCKEGFIKAIKSHRFFKPERVKFICKGDRPVATTTAWGDVHGDESLAMVHMVGTDPEFRGLGLGYAVTNAVLHHMKAEGWKAAYLTTDDFRVPALKIYLKLGFVPDLSQKGHAERWDALQEKIQTKWTGGGN